MTVQNEQHIKADSATQPIPVAVHSVHPSQHHGSTYTALYSVEQFAVAQLAFTASSLRNLIFKANPRTSSKGEIAGNGLLECGAIIRVGRKVLIDGEKFIAWIRNQNRGDVS